MRKLGSFGMETDSIARPFRETWDAFFAAQLLVIRGQRLSPSEFLNFARQFGRPAPHVIDQFHHPQHVDILILSNRKKDGKPIGLADAGTYFHTDYSYLDIPRAPRCSIRSRCRRKAATRSSPTNTAPTTTCPRR